MEGSTIADRPEKKASKAASPPAEAPMPTMGKLLFRVGGLTSDPFFDRIPENLVWPEASGSSSVFGVVVGVTMESFFLLILNQQEGNL